MKIRAREGTRRERLLAMALTLGCLCGLMAFSSPLPANPPSAQATVTPHPQRVHPKDYQQGGALAIRGDATFQFLTTGGPVRLEVVELANESPTITSGTVRLGLFLTVEPTPVDAYWVVGSSDLGTLQPGFSFGPISQTVSYVPPPDGIFYIHMGVFEHEPATCAAPGSFCLDDFVTFEGRVQVLDGQIYEAAPPAPGTAVAVEYIHPQFNHYFITSLVDEIAALDAGLLQGWIRTGHSFQVWTTNQGNVSGVCRFFSTAFAPKSSHFYTPYADECTTLRSNPDWQFETISFYVEFPSVSGACLAGAQPLYRLYNDGQGGAPNHRYTIDLGVRQQMVNEGWVPEGYGPLGTIACVPV